jgi:hypothetical protein
MLQKQEKIIRAVSNFYIFIIPPPLPPSFYYRMVTVEVPFTNFTFSLTHLE